MTPRHRISPAAIELIKRFEGYRRQAAQLPDGRWTIGHGHLQTARKGAEVSRDDAEALLLYDLIPVAHTLNEQVFTPLGQNQFDALASFTFNIGVDSFIHSGVLRRLNEGALLQAASAMSLWRKAQVNGEHIVVDALVRRRAAEKILFLTPPGGAWVAAPSAVLRPLLDTDSDGTVPRSSPAHVTTTLEGEAVSVLRDGEPTPTPLAPEDEAESPARAAAESVTARLQTIFQESTDRPAIETAAPPEPAPVEPRPQADFAPPFTPGVELEAEEEPFMLTSPIEEDDAAPVAEKLRFEEDGPRGPDLFDAEPDDPPRPREAAPAFKPAFTPLEEPPYDMQPFEAIEPYDFLKPTAQPLPEQPKAGLFGLLILAMAGLAFFAGGVFWATNARPTAEAGGLDPRMVGWLAGVAGVGFFAVAVYLLLQRLGRASERFGRARRT
jgi:lysozyme